RRGGVGVQPQMHHSVLPLIGLPQPDRVAKTLAPVGPQGPPARRAARLVAVATRARGALLWTTGTRCAGAGNSRSCNQSTACHNRVPSRQSPGTKHLRRESEEGRQLNHLRGSEPLKPLIPLFAGMTRQLRRRLETLEFILNRALSVKITPD